MQSGGTRQTILVATALAASVVLAAWWWSASTHQPEASNALTKTMRSGAARRGGAMAGGDILASGKSPSASGSRAQNHEAEAAPEGGVETRSEAEKPSTAPVASVPKADMQSSDADAKPASPVVDETSTSESGDESSPSVDENAASDTAKSEAENPETETSLTSDESGTDAAPGSAVDTDRAADLIANYLASLDAGEHADSEDARNQHEFDARETGGDDERHVEEMLRKGISAWIATLPADDAAGLALMSVECRVGQCRILVAQARYGVGPDTTPADQERQRKLLAAFHALTMEPWWQALGLRTEHFASFPAGDGSGMGLWIEYDTIAAGPASATADGG